jgi:drug/metabolite transporter (DMT)-like permease
LLRLIPRALRISWMWLGVALMTIAFFSLLAALSVQNVSFVVPVTALSYAAGALGAQLFLGEKVTTRRWVGVLLVCFGVALVIAGHK